MSAQRPRCGSLVSVEGMYFLIYNRKIPVPALFGGLRGGGGANVLKRLRENILNSLRTVIKSFRSDRCFRNLASEDTEMPQVCMWMDVHNREPTCLLRWTGQLLSSPSLVTVKHILKLIIQTLYYI